MLRKGLEQYLTGRKVLLRVSLLKVSSSLLHQKRKGKSTSPHSYHYLKLSLLPLLVPETSAMLDPLQGHVTCRPPSLLASP